MASKSKVKSKLKSNRVVSGSTESIPESTNSSPSPPGYTYTDNDIRQQIRICLMRIKQDDAFVDGELSSKDYGPIKKGNNPDMMEKFMDFVAKSLVKTNKAKKVFKQQRLLPNNRKLLRTEIEKFDPKTYVMEEPVVTKINPKDDIMIPAKNTKKKDKDTHQMQLDDDNNHDDDGDDNDDDDNDGKKVAGAKKRRRPSSSNNNAKTSMKESSNKKKKSVAFRLKRKERQRMAEEMKREYLSQKADVLERLPESYKKQWGQIMFCKWKKDPHRPVLILGPYQVHPELRETWMKMFNNTKGDPQRMWQYCYWYGSPDGEAYTQQKLSSLVPLEKAVAAKLDKPPANYQAKLDAGKKLKGVEEQIMKAFAGLQDELNKKPEERIPIAFREDYEGVLTLADEVSLDGCEVDDDDDDDDTSTDDDTSSESITPVKKPVKKKIKPALEEKTDNVIIKKTTKKQTPVIKKKLKSATEKTKTVPSPPTEIVDIGEAELSEGDDDKMEEDSEEAVIEDDDDDEDLNYDEEEKVGKVKKKKAVPTKKPPPDGETKTSAKKEKKIPVKATKKESKHVGSTKTEQILDPEEDAIVQKRRKADRLRKLKLKEAKEYSACVKRFKSVIDSLSEAIETKDLSNVVACLKELKKDVNAMTAPFIEEYKLAQIMKSAKTILVGHDERQVRKDLFEEMKVVYAAKKDHVPEGWREALAKLEPKIEATKKDSPESNEDNESQNKPGPDVKQENQALETNGTVADVTGSHKARHVLNHQSSGGVESEPASLPRKPGFQKSRVESPQSTPASTKPVKKKIMLSSWKSLMNSDKPKEKIEPPKPLKSRLFDETKTVTKLPEWLTKEQEVDSAETWNDDRNLGLEFFDEATLYFPDTVKRTSVARALERAAFAWATQKEMPNSSDDDNWKMIYWSKVHSIVGAIAGKHTTGTLVQAILDGKYASAEIIIGLPDEVLFASFEGKPIGGLS